MNIFTSIKTRNLKMLKKLIGKKADPNIRDINGLTPLMQLVQMPLTNKFVLTAIEILLKNGADINAVDKNELSVLMHADNFEYTEEDNLIYEKTFHCIEEGLCDFAECLALCGCYYDDVSIFISYLKEYNSQEILKKIYSIKRKNRIKLFNLLCKYKPNFYYQNSKGQHALILAAQERNYFKCCSIVERDANLMKLRDNDGVLAVDYALNKGYSTLDIDE